MSRKDKLLDKAYRQPGGLKFAEFEKLLEQCGWIFRRQSGSHRLWYSLSGYRLPIQPKGSNAKTYQVKHFLEQWEKENDEPSRSI